MKQRHSGRHYRPVCSTECKGKLAGRGKNNDRRFNYGSKMKVFGSIDCVDNLYTWRIYWRAMGMFHIIQNEKPFDTKENCKNSLARWLYTNKAQLRNEL